MDRSSSSHRSGLRITRKHLLAASALCAVGIAAACAASPRDEHIKPYATGGNANPTGTGASTSLGGNTGLGGAGSGGLPMGFGGEIEPPAQFTKGDLLQSIAACTGKVYDDFATKADALKDAAAAWAAAPADVDARGKAKSAWNAAMSTWQIAEGFSIGPALPTTEPAGQGLRDQIYSWPLVNRCNVDKNILNKVYELPAFGSAAINQRTLSALEYLAFYEPTDNGCTSGLDQGAWSALGDAEITARKAAYASVVAAQVAETAHTLALAWSPTGGNFTQTFISKRDAGSPYATDQAALNAAYNALYYFELSLKDLKLALPFGLSPDCVSDCASQVESRYASANTSNLRSNVVAFRLMFDGCGANYTGLGFDDWLRSVGAGDVADAVDEDIRVVETTLSTFPPLEQVAANNASQANDLYTKVKAVSDVLKTSVVTDLNLDLPKGAEGDND